MLYDGVKVFEKMLREEAERAREEGWGDMPTESELETKLLVDNYVPKDGIYILLNMDKTFACKELEIRLDKKSGGILGEADPLYPYIRYLDYNSKLIEMNKPVDTKKVIHSNQIFAFWIKKDSINEKKLTPEIIDGYYKMLANPELKYLKPKAKELYGQTAEEIGELDIQALERIRTWVKEWQKNPSRLAVDISSLSGKDYIKFFFVYEDVKKTKEVFERENRRYTIPNIYNNNDYNEKANGTIFGPPSNNMGLNAKKPFLENRTRKTKAPYLVSKEEVVWQGRFFDYLWGCACKGKVNIYIDFDRERIYALSDKNGGDSDKIPFVESGMYLRIKKGKEVEIIDCDAVVDLNPNLKVPFCFREIVEAKDDSVPYGTYTRTEQLGAVIDEVFFSRQLAHHYFTDPMELTIKDDVLENILLTYRERLFTWLYKTPKCDMRQVIGEMSMKLIQNSIANGFGKLARKQLNLSLSLADYFQENHEKEEKMKMVQKQFKMHMDMQEEWEFEDDGEYYYGVGQLVSYFLSLSKASKKPYSLANQFLNAREDALIKENLNKMFARYSHAIDVGNLRVRNIMSHIMLYHPEGSVRQTELIAGLTASNAFYIKKEK